jgi:hypothetical protein
MKNLFEIVERVALAVAILSPTAACAEPAGQAASSKRPTNAKAAGVSLSTFVSRRDKKLLADDIDGDGKVSRSEFIAAVKSGKADPARRFARIDANGDGTLDKPEIDAMLSRRFRRLDINGDGMLNAAERTTAQARKNRNAGEEPES